MCGSIPLFDLELGEAARTCSRMGLLGDGDLLLASVGDVMALLTGDAVLGVATDNVWGIAMIPAFIVCLRPRPSNRFRSGFWEQSLNDSGILCPHSMQIRPTLFGSRLSYSFCHPSAVSQGKKRIPLDGALYDGSQQWYVCKETVSGCLYQYSSAMTPLKNELSKHSCIGSVAM